MLETLTFLRSVDDTLVVPWLEKLSDLGMDCELHPAFSFSSQRGFLPIRLGLRRPVRGLPTSTTYLTGFEFYLSDFELKTQFPTRAGGLSRFFGRKFRVSSSVDPILTRCTKQLTFRWGSADVFELRMASLSSLILAELGGGIRYYPADLIWYERGEAIAEELRDIEEYEAGRSDEDIQRHIFNGWI